MAIFFLLFTVLSWSGWSWAAKEFRRYPGQAITHFKALFTHDFCFFSYTSVSIDSRFGKSSLEHSWPRYLRGPVGQRLETESRDIKRYARLWVAVRQGGHDYIHRSLLHLISFLRVW